MIQEEEARKLAIQSLKSAIEKHHAGEWLSIGDGLEEFEKLAPENEIEKNTLLFYVLEFWSSWVSCAEHTWEFEPTINEQEWPLLASELIENLKEKSLVTNSKIIQVCN
jgi:hypothetical protein